MSATIISNTLLTSLATVERLARQTQGGGQWQEAWNVVATNVRCNVQYSEAQTTQSVLPAGQTTAVTTIIRFPATADVQPDDRITVAGRRYRVIAANVKTNAWTLVALCREWGDE